MDSEPRRPFPAVGAQFVYDLARDKIKIQFDQGDALDTKLAAFLAVGSALLGVMAAVLALRGGQIPVAAIVLLALTGSSYAVLAAACFCGLRLRNWEAAPKLKDAWAHARQFTEPQLYWWAAEAYTKFFGENEKLIESKVCATKAAIGLLMVETVLLVLGLGVIALD